MRLQEDKRPGHKFELTARAPSIDTKVEAGKRLPLPRIPFEHHFRLVQILAPFLLVGDARARSERSALPALSKREARSVVYGAAPVS
jgi:hypothetical protein